MSSADERPSAITIDQRHLFADSHLWAANYPAVRKACFIARVCANRAPEECRLLDFPAILQSGPTCGLTALSMLCRGEPSPEELLTKARQLGLTHNGEMFSANSLLRMVGDTSLGSSACRPDQRTLTAVWLHRGKLFDGVDDADENGDAKMMNAVGDDAGGVCSNCADDSTATCIKSTLRNGGCLLVPYPFSKWSCIIIRMTICMMTVARTDAWATRLLCLCVGSCSVRSCIARVRKYPGSEAPCAICVFGMRQSNERARGQCERVLCLGFVRVHE